MKGSAGCHQRCCGCVRCFGLNRREDLETARERHRCSREEQTRCAPQKGIWTKVQARLQRCQGESDSLSPHVGIPRATLHHYLRLGVLGKSGSAVKPTLTPVNKIAMVECCRRFVEADGCFGLMLDRVDIDEKRWHLTEKNLLVHCCPW